MKYKMLNKILSSEPGIWPRGPGSLKWLNLSYLIVIQVTTTIERQPCAFVVAIMINLEPGPWAGFH